ncbi:MAG: amino acid permease [Acidobacteria bacterium]|nr:amino acid permease [Acidobacteriota bacterium]
MTARPAESTERGLGFWMCTALVTGNMIGSGVYLLPAALAPYGALSLLGWLFTVSGALVLALVFARLSRMVPGAGGPYAFTRAGFGDFAGFLVAWGYWISIWAGNAAIAVAFVSYLGFFFPALANNGALAAALAIASVWGLTVINGLGVRTAGKVQLVTTILKLAPLIAIGVFGLFYMKVENFAPVNPSGKPFFSAVTSAAALALWAFLGLESATIPAGDVRNPQKTIPRATILGTLLSSAVYMIGTAAVMGIIPSAELKNSTAPFADAARALWGGWAGYAVAAGAAISCFGALNGWILLQGQLPRAAAIDGLFPALFRRISPRGTPLAGLVLSSILVSLLVVTNYTRGLVGMFTFIILLSTLTALFPYVFCAMSALVLYNRERESTGERRLLGPSILASLAFAYSLWAIAGSGQETVFWGFLLLMGSLPVYVWIKRPGSGL